MPLSRTACAVLIALTILACASSPQPLSCENSNPPLASHVVLSSIVWNTEQQVIEERFQGSGTVISIIRGRVYVLTARHVVDTDARDPLPEGQEWRRVVAITLKGPIFPIRIEKGATNGTDAIVVSFNPGEEHQRLLQIAQIAARDPRVGEQLLVFGAPDATFRVRARREVRRYCRPRDNCGLCSIEDRCYLLNEGIRPGFSGGGVWDRRGHLAGMCIGYRYPLGDDPFMGMCLPISTLRPLVNPYLR